MSGPWYRVPSIYAQKMRRLGCKIFGEYYKPPAPPDLVMAGLKGHGSFPYKRWEDHQYHNLRMFERLSYMKPYDIDPDRNTNYYPPHPQIRELMYTLRQHGLYRDEHLDFREEMKRLRILRGKKYRQLGGMSGKRAALRGDSKK